MPVQTAAILNDLKPSGLLLEMRGPDIAVARIAAADSCGPGDLVFVDAPEHAVRALERRPAAAVARADLAARLSALTVLVAANVRLAHAQIGQRWFDRPLRDEGWPRLHPSAVIHETASVPASATVGPNAVVGARAKLGERCVVLAGAIVERDAVLGDGTVVHPNAVVGYACEAGRNVLIKAGAVIGSEGFGFAQDAKRRNHRIPQLGRVVLGDNVVVGAACCIDRATFGETRIGAGTILDNLCHVAHNVRIGEDCILTAMLCVAGSTTIGDRVVTSGMTGILDHLNVCDDAVFVQRAGVGNDVKEPGMYAGSPIQPFRDYTKNVAVFHRLAEMRATVRELEGKVAALEAAHRA